MKKVLSLFLFGLGLFSFMSTTDVFAVPGGDGCEIDPLYCLDDGDSGSGDEPSSVPHDFKYNDGGITYWVNPKEPIITEDECRFPELFVEDTTDNKQKCYSYSIYSNPYSADINGDRFYYGEYDVLQWEYDFDNLFFNGQNILVDTADRFGVGLDSNLGFYQRFLPMVHIDGVPRYYYKTQIVKFNPELYAQIDMVLSIYETMVQAEGDQHMADMTESLVDAALVWIPDEYSDAADMLAFFEAYAEGDTEGLIQLFVGAVEDQTCDYFEDHGGEFAESICEVFLASYVEQWSLGQVIDFEQVRLDAVAYLSENLEDIITELAIEIAKGMLVEAVKASNPAAATAISVAETIGHVFDAIQSYNLAQDCYAIVANLQILSKRFVITEDNWGVDLRIDYIADWDHNVLKRDEINSVTSIRDQVVLHQNTEIMFSNSNTDVLYSTPYPSASEHVEVWDYDQWDPATSSWGVLVGEYDITFTCRGTLSMLTSDEFINQFQIDINNRSENTPLDVYMTNPYERSFKSASIEQVEQTPDKNRFMSNQDSYQGPNVTLVGRTSSSITYEVTNSNEFIDFDLHMILGGQTKVVSLLPSETVTVTFTGLNGGQTYNLKSYLVVPNSGFESEDTTRSDSTLIAKPIVTVSSYSYTRITFKVVNPNPTKSVQLYVRFGSSSTYSYKTTIAPGGTYYMTYSGLNSDTLYRSYSKFRDPSTGYYTSYTYRSQRTKEDPIIIGW